MDSNKNNKIINLGGFPPLFYDTNEIKVKKEFAEKFNKNTSKNINNINKLNLLNVKNILGK